MDLLPLYNSHVISCQALVYFLHSLYKAMAKILIIEDDGDLQHMLSIAFNQEKYDVHYAFNGKEGYEKILSVQPDVILLDLMMPVLNGVEVIKLVISNTLVRDIPIIVMTAHGDKADMLEHSLKAQGVREYV